jgi:ABC-type phosphate transport system substrate-binding protein
MFIPPNLPSGWSALNSTELAKFTHGTNQFSEYGVIFAVEATEDVYRDLQRTQSLVSYPTPDDPVANPTDWTEAKRPSLKRSEVITLLKGDLTNWLDFNAAMVNAGTTPSITGANGLMAVCRRVPGSGTQAAANAYWMENPCRAGSLVAGNTNMTAASNSQPGYQVVENSATGDVLTCLNDAYSAIDFGTATFFGAKHGGIGFTAIDIAGGSTPHPVHPADHYDFVKIDGVSPTVANATSGAYNYWFEQSIQWLKTADGGPSGSILTLLGKVRDVSGNPSTITGVPISGVAALGENGWDWKNVAHTPTMRGQHNGNSCREVLLSK